MANDWQLALAQTKALRRHGVSKELEDELFELIVRWYIA